MKLMKIVEIMKQMEISQMLMLKRELVKGLLLKNSLLSLDINISQF